MTASDLKTYLQKYTTVSTEEVELFYSLLVKKKIPNRKYLLKVGEVCDNFSLISSGCMMNYFIDKNENIQVLQFATKMWWTADLNSLINQKPAEYSIRATTDTVVYQLSRSNWEILYREAPVFERFFRMLFQNALVAHQKRIIENISETAECRYILFREKYPTVEQLVPQKYIASYLGITPEFLSKIRRNLAKS